MEKTTGMVVNAAEWSREVSSGDEQDESDEKQRGPGEKERTFDGNELDSNDSETEAGVCVELHLSSDGIACNVELVGKGDGESDL